MSGGTICRGCIDQYPQKIETARDIPLRVKRVNNILGTDIDAGAITRIIESLNMTIHSESEGTFRVNPPTYRVDITREIDLIEEIARIYGYDRVPVTLPPISVVTVMKDHKEILVDRIREILKGAGFSEIITYSFISPGSADLLGLKSDDRRRKSVKIRNPLLEDQSIMRTTLIGSLLETMRKNAHNSFFDLKVFEIGRVFSKRLEGELPIEKNLLGCLVTGLWHDDLWSSKKYADFYDLKGSIENIFDGLKISGFKFRSDCMEPFLHPGKSCSIHVGEQLIGFLGEVHSDVLIRMDLKNRAYIAEIDLDFLKRIFSDEIRYRGLPRYPSVVRDVAFIVGEDLEANTMIEFATDIGKELLEKISIFDVYSGKSIPCGKKSLGLRFTYRASERTLTDDEVNNLHSGIVKSIVDLTGAKIRGEEN
jgi:phenylalanyl-tRNA synthetase beta chain